MNDLEVTTTHADKANFEALPQILLWRMAAASCLAGQLWEPGRADHLAQDCAPCAQAAKSEQTEPSACPFFKISLLLVFSIRSSPM
jgi:hypothetical protein